MWGCFYTVSVFQGDEYIQSVTASLCTKTYIIYESSDALLKQSRRGRPNSNLTTDWHFLTFRFKRMNWQLEPHYCFFLQNNISHSQVPRVYLTTDWRRERTCGFTDVCIKMSKGDSRQAGVCWPVINMEKEVGALQCLPLLRIWAKSTPLLLSWTPLSVQSTPPYVEGPDLHTNVYLSSIYGLYLLAWDKKYY